MALQDTTHGTLAAHLSADPPDALAIARQAAWEVAAVNRAIAKYREAAAARDPAELPPGRRVLVETVAPVSARIEALLDQATATAGRPEAWHGPLLLFEPDVLAFIAVSAGLRAGVLTGSRVGSPVTAFARRVCGVLRDQADHDRWMAETTKAAKGDDKGARMALARWRKLFPDGSRRAWTRFASRLDGARSARWDDAVRASVGGVLAHAVAEGAPKWFELARLGDDPREAFRPMCLALTDYAVERMADVEARSEVSRPLMLPMLIPPSPWRWAQRTDNQETANAEAA